MSADHPNYPWKIEDLATAIAIFSHANVKSDRAGSSLREVMLALLDPNDLARETMANLKIEPYRENGGLIPLPDLVAQLEVANPDHQDYWRMFGIRPGSTFSQLVHYGADTLRTLATRIPESEDAERLLADTRKLVGEPIPDER